MSDGLLKAIARSSLSHNLQVIPIPNPAAGAEIIITPRAGEDWRIIGMRATLTTSAAAGSRVPELVWDDQTSIGAGVVALTTQPVSIACTYDFTSLASGFSSGALAAGGKANVGFGEIILPTGYRMRTITTALDAADQWSAITVSFERLDEPPWRNLLIGTPEESELEHDIAMFTQGG